MKTYLIQQLRADMQSIMKSPLPSSSSNRPSTSDQATDSMWHYNPPISSRDYPPGTFLKEMPGAIERGAHVLTVSNGGIDLNEVTCRNAADGMYLASKESTPKDIIDQFVLDEPRCLSLFVGNVKLSTASIKCFLDTNKEHNPIAIFIVNNYCQGFECLPIGLLKYRSLEAGVKERRRDKVVIFGCGDRYGIFSQQGDKACVEGKLWRVDVRRIPDGVFNNGTYVPGSIYFKALSDVSLNNSEIDWSTAQIIASNSLLQRICAIPKPSQKIIDKLIGDNMLMLAQLEEQAHLLLAISVIPSEKRNELGDWLRDIPGKLENNSYTQEAIAKISSQLEARLNKLFSKNQLKLAQLEQEFRKLLFIDDSYKNSKLKELLEYILNNIPQIVKMHGCQMTIDMCLLIKEMAKIAAEQQAPLKLNECAKHLVEKALAPPTPKETIDMFKNLVKTTKAPVVFAFDNVGFRTQSMLNHNNTINHNITSVDVLIGLSGACHLGQATGFLCTHKLMWSLIESDDIKVVKLNIKEAFDILLKHYHQCYSEYQRTGAEEQAAEKALNALDDSEKSLKRFFSDATRFDGINFGKRISKDDDLKKYIKKELMTKIEVKLLMKLRWSDIIPKYLDICPNASSPLEESVALGMGPGPSCSPLKQSIIEIEHQSTKTATNSSDKEEEIEGLDFPTLTTVGV